MAQKPYNPLGQGLPMAQNPYNLPSQGLPMAQNPYNPPSPSSPELYRELYEKAQKGDTEARNELMDRYTWIFFTPFSEKKITELRNLWDIETIKFKSLSPKELYFCCLAFRDWQNGFSGLKNILKARNDNSFWNFENTLKDLGYKIWMKSLKDPYANLLLGEICFAENSLFHAKEYLKNAADQGLMQAQFRYAVFLYAADPVTSEHYMRLAANQGYPEALCHYALGHPVTSTEKLLPESLKLLKLSADLGHAPAEHYYGKMTDNLDEKLIYSKRAAEQGWLPARELYCQTIYRKSSLNRSMRPSTPELCDELFKKALGGDDVARHELTDRYPWIYSNSTQDKQDDIRKLYGLETLNSDLLSLKDLQIIFTINKSELFQNHNQWFLNKMKLLARSNNDPMEAQLFLDLISIYEQQNKYEFKIKDFLRQESEMSPGRENIQFLCLIQIPNLKSLDMNDLKFLQNAEKKGSTLATMNLVNYFYKQANNKITPDVLKHLKPLLDQGYPPVQYFYAKNIPNREEKLKYSKLAADQGFVPAQTLYNQLTQEQPHQTPCQNQETHEQKALSAPPAPSEKSSKSEKTHEEALTYLLDQDDPHKNHISSSTSSIKTDFEKLVQEGIEVETKKLKDAHQKEIDSLKKELEELRAIKSKAMPQ
jgi:TPR repeat protein